MSVYTKILVNKVPVVAEDCPFCCEVQHYGYVCSVIGYACQLTDGKKCPCLLSYYEFENYGNGIQSPWWNKENQNEEDT